MTYFDLFRRRYLTLVGLLLLAAPGCGPTAPPRLRTTPPRRIVSLGPSITETLHALGLGERIVGVTKYCKYPPEAASKTAVGGHLDTNLETIVGLEPDLVVVLKEQEELRTHLERLGIETLTVNHQTIEGILDSLGQIGARCHCDDAASRLEKQLRERLVSLEALCARQQPVRVLLVVDRSLGVGRIEDLYVAGSSPFFNETLRIVGAENVARGSVVAFPIVSRERVIHMAPDVILDFTVSSDPTRDPATDWQSLAAEVEAVRAGRVYRMTADYATIPGPRFVQLLEDMAALLHPDAFTSAAVTHGQP